MNGGGLGTWAKWHKWDRFPWRLQGRAAPPSPRSYWAVCLLVLLQQCTTPFNYNCFHATAGTLRAKIKPVIFLIVSPEAKFGNNSVVNKSIQACDFPDSPVVETSPSSARGILWIPGGAAHQAPPSLGFSRQEHWSGLPFPYLASQVRYHMPHGQKT